MFFRRCGILGLIGALALGAARAAEETWVKVSTEHFTILTPAGEAVARTWAVELEQFRRALEAAVPVEVARLRPVTVVLFTHDRAMEPYLPLEQGKAARLGGMFVRANDINTIMLSLARDAGETRQKIFHEAVHWHLSALDGPMPLWLGEGLAELYATFVLPPDGKTYAFGEPMERYIVQLRGRNLLPLPQLLGIDRGSLLYNEGTRASVFYAQSWAFAHFLFHGEDSPGRGAVMRYLALLKTASPQEAFTQAFGGNYAEVEARLRRYIRSGSYRKHAFPRAPQGREPAMVAQPATRAELELAKGSLLFGTRTPEEAEPHLRLAASLAPGDPRAWELLGHLATVRRDFEAATAALTKAAAAGSTSYLVYHNLALSRLPKPLVPGLLHFTPADLDKAAADYRRALQLSPAHLPSYEGLAGLVYGMETFEPSDLDLLGRGLAQAPGSSMIEAGLAAGEIRAGRLADGRARLQRLCARGGDANDEGLKFARQILADETINDELAEIERLAKQNRFAEILTVIDRALARGLDPRHHRTMTELRLRMADFHHVAGAVEQANKGDREGAARLLEAFVAGHPDPAAKAEAERILRDIARSRGGRGDHGGGEGGGRGAMR